jgi:molybdate transport system permease protein
VEMNSGAPQENVFPCQLVRSSETPFRVTLYLSLRQSGGATSKNSSFDLQAEVTKETFRLIRERPMPWLIQLRPESIFLLPDESPRQS